MCTEILGRSCATHGYLRSRDLRQTPLNGCQAHYICTWLSSWNCAIHTDIHHGAGAHGWPAGAAQCGQLVARSHAHDPADAAAAAGLMAPAVKQLFSVALLPHTGYSAAETFGSLCIFKGDLAVP